MPPSKRDRRSVMDLHSTPGSPVHSRKSSLSLTENSVQPSENFDQKRRPSASQIIPIVSQSLLIATNGLKRSPLAPLDPQLSVTLNTDITMPHDEDAQSGRKPSFTLTNATRPTPYSQRNIPRRPLPSQQRRTSLPSLHPAVDATLPPPPTVPVEPSNSQDDDIYSRLSTFTFGEARSSQQLLPIPSTSRTDEDTEGISPLQPVASFDRTPRPSVTIPQLQLGQGNPASATSGSYKLLNRANGWSSPSEDEEERRRTNTRSKMRAIDDGTRRPSLPSNDILRVDSQSPSALNTSTNERLEGRNLTRLETSQMTDRAGVPLSSPSSVTDGEGGFDLDTDLDLMSGDYSDRRAQGMSDRSSLHNSMADGDGDGDERISSDMGSVYGDDEFERDNVIDEDEDEDIGGDPLRKDSARTWTQHDTGRRRSLPMDIPYPNLLHSHPHPHSSHGHRPLDTAPFSGSRSLSHREDNSPDFDARALAQAQFRRPSRSVDDDLQRATLHLRRKVSRVSVTAATTAMAPAMSISGAMGPMGAMPSSEPDTRGVARAQAMVEVMSPRHDIESLHNGTNGQGIKTDDAAAFMALGSPSITDISPYQGLDLNYIYSVSGPSGAGSIRGNGGSDSWSVARLSVGSSVAAREGRERENSWTFGWGINQGGVGRRPSTATVNDDTFLRFVKKNDFSYDERRREWSFAREPSGSDTSMIHSRSDYHEQEIWRCLWVGKYKMDRIYSKNTEPNKPVQVRLNIRHMKDPYSKGNTQGGPTSFIHKHSRARAFSIFRGHSLPHRHLKTSWSILLAPKKVQEQFTSTRTTSKLSTHGLLEEHNRSQQSLQTASGSTSTSLTLGGSSHGNTASSSTLRSTSHKTITSQGSHGSSRSQSKSEKRPEVDRKGKGVARPPGSITHSSSQTSVSNSTTASSSTSDIKEISSARTPINYFRMAEHPHRSMDMNGRPPSSIADTASITSDGSYVFSSSLSAWDQSSIGSSSRHVRRPVNLRQQISRLPPTARGSVGSLDDQPVMRTSHAEAFTTLEPPVLESIRMHRDGSPEHDSEKGRFKSIKKLFHTQQAKSAPKNSPLAPGLNVAALEGHYTPPWLRMTARTKQEEQERMIKSLNDSFRDVGLLPMFKPAEKKNAAKSAPKASRPRSHKKNKNGSENVFDQIPDDSLYMLLPMWPSETDPNSALFDDDTMEYDVPLQERQYLLVYYVPMLSKEKTEKMDEKKRTRGSQTSSANSHHSDSSNPKENKTSIALNAFNILARLVSYKDVNGSGIRIPTSGLAVTGLMSDAIRAIPQVRFQMDDLALIIGFCDKLERGVELLPEGAEKLGLCLPRTSPDPDSDAPLSSLGRAAVEMAWLGALAIMGYVNPS